MNRPALIVDDNDDYTAMLLSHLEPMGYSFERARDAAEGLQKMREMGNKYFELVVTDITMESQTAGLSLIRKLRREGYKGLLMVASTGVNNPVILHLTRLFYRLWGADLLVPKEPLKKGLFQCVVLTPAGREFDK
jgi:CheY-like chemotaxis protein